MAQWHGTTERQNGNGRMATEWWKLGMSLTDYEV